jgi:hypothetical protein
MLELQHGSSACALVEAVPGRPTVALRPYVSGAVGESATEPSERAPGWVDPRKVPSLPGPPPRLTAARAASGFAEPAEVPFLVEPDVRPRSRGKGAGFTISALMHMGLVVGLSLILGPLRLGRDQPVKLNLANAPPELPVRPVELETALEDELVAPRFDLMTAVPSAGPAPLSAQSVAGPFDGNGASGPQGSFFGTVAHGNRFVYVLDVSGSMKARRGRRKAETRLKCAIDELMYSVDKLMPDQYFYVVLFSYETRHMFDEETLLPQLIPATPENKRRLRAWLEGVRADSGTDPRVALDMALRMRPSAVFLLSDGEFNGQQSKNNRGLLNGNPSVEEVVAAHEEHKVPVHTIALEDRANRKNMQTIASQTGGEYRYVPPIVLPGVK